MSTAARPMLACQIKRLRALAAVAATGSTVQAAVALNVSQSSVTRAIQAAEVALGAALFHRLERGMAPTPTGALVTRRATRALACLAQLGQPAGKPGADRPAPWMVNRFAMGVAYRHLQVLLTLSDTSAQATAASDLGISQPAVQQSLAQLEFLAGKPLFLRARNGLRLTELGEAAVKAVKLALAELQQADEELALQQGATQGRLVIGTLPFSTVLLVPEAVDQLVRAHPGLGITIVDGTYDALVHQLRHAEIDIMLGALRPAPPGADLRQEELFVDNLSVVARATHPLAARRALGWSELQNARWIMPMPNTPAEAAFVQALQAAGVPYPPSPLRVNSALMMQSLLVQSDRLALMSPRHIQHEIDAGLLVVLDLPVHHAPRAIGLLTRADYLPTPGAQVLLDALRSVGQKITGEISRI